MRIPKKALLLAVQRGVAVEDAFSTSLYTGNGSTQTITNGIDLTGEGGLVWVKWRTGASSFTDHRLFDTVRGENLTLSTNTTSAEGSRTFGFSSNGFTLSNADDINRSGDDYASWTFRQAPKFFDIVQYTGDGTSGRELAHDLGIKPGMIVVKRLDLASPWFVFHRDNTTEPSTDFLILNRTDATADAATVWNDTAPTDSEFTLGSDPGVNASGGTYIAYLFAHDPSNSGIIQCGSYDGNGSATGPMVSTGWESQWILIKRVDATQNWYIFDSARGMPAVSGNAPALLANLSNAEITSTPYVATNADGFQITTSDSGVNASGGKYIYLTIRAPE